MSGPFRDDDFPAEPLTTGQPVELPALAVEPGPKGPPPRLFSQVPTPCLRRRCLIRDLGPLTAGWWCTTAFFVTSASWTDLLSPLVVAALFVLGGAGWLSHLQFVLARRTHDIHLPPISIDETTLHVPGPRGRITRIDLHGTLCVEPVRLQTRRETPALYIRQHGRAVLIQGTPGDVPEPTADWPPVPRPHGAFDAYLSSTDIVRIEALLRRRRAPNAPPRVRTRETATP